MSSKLIIGKNSRIVKSIAADLKGFDIVSHLDLPTIDLEKYDFIFLFSWGYHSLDSNLNHVKLIPAKRLVFISSMSILSLKRRRQWNRYPNDKHHVEAHALAAGSTVLRIGVTDPEYARNVLGSFSFTPTELLRDALINWSGGDSNDRIINLFEIRKGSISGVRRTICRVMIQVSHCFPAYALFQIPIQGISKVLGFKSYGYADDSNYFINSELLIGYGALGSHYDTVVRQRAELVLVSGRVDEKWNENGFRNTLIGNGLIGLARLWHAVAHFRKPDDENRVAKKVPLWVRRPRPPRSRRAIAHVNSLKFNGKFWSIHGVDSKRNEIQFFTNVLVLAAGPTQNVRFLGSIVPISCSLSDQEIGMVGTCDLEDAIQLQAVIKIGPFLLRRYSLSGVLAGWPTLLDIRPLVPNKHIHTAENAAFYLDSTLTLLGKMTRSFSVYRINEAFFNKFGISFVTRNCSVFAQTLVPNCIQFSPQLKGTDQFHRQRLSEDEWLSIIKSVTEIIPTFKSTGVPVTVDAQHILGGAEMLKAQKIQDLCNAGSLIILGSPTNEPLGALHHTHGIMNWISKTYSS